MNIKEGKGETRHTNPSLLPAPLHARLQLAKFTWDKICLFYAMKIRHKN